MPCLEDIEIEISGEQFEELEKKLKSFPDYAECSDVGRTHGMGTISLYRDKKYWISWSWFVSGGHRIWDYCRSKEFPTDEQFEAWKKELE